VLPLNIESEVVDGVAAIAQRLATFLRPFTGLDISSLG
jgi:hypothetical protein